MSLGSLSLGLYLLFLIHSLLSSSVLSFFPYPLLPTLVLPCSLLLSPVLSCFSLFLFSSLSDRVRPLIRRLVSRIVT